MQRFSCWFLFVVVAMVIGMGLRRNKSFSWSLVVVKLQELMMDPLTVLGSEHSMALSLSSLASAMDLTVRSSLPRVSWAYMMDREDDEFYDSILDMFGESNVDVDGSFIRVWSIMRILVMMMLVSIYILSERLQWL